MPLLAIEDAETLVANALIASGCTPGNALSTAQALVAAAKAAGVPTA